MITHIQMKNFKSWKDSGEVKLAPLTGFFGKNSSGKSSLLQMLLLLKQTVEQEETEHVIFFGDDKSLVNLGDFREVIHGHNVEEQLELAFRCRLQNPFTIKISDTNSHDFSLDVDSFTFETTIVCKEGNPIVQDGCYRVKYEDKEELIHCDFSKRIYGEIYRLPIMSNDSIILFSSEFKKLFLNVYYFGPTRVHPQRSYHWETTHPKEIDMWGNEAVDALLSARVRQLTTYHNGKCIPIEDLISKWLQKMELAHSFWLGPVNDLEDNNYEVRIKKSPNSAGVTLADIGHGVADLFPLLVHCCYVPEGSILILEQPGIHLHPKVQSNLADLLIEVVNERNLQILVESHSEHLLNRLQRRIAEEKISVEKTALYFCRNNEGVSNIEHLKMDEFGNILNWPEKFFGDEMGDLFAMTKAQSQRRKNAEG